MSFFDQMRKQKFLSFTLILFTLAIGVLIGTVINTGVKAAKESAVAPGATPLVIPNPVQLSTAFSQLAKQLEPSVVNISTTYVQKAPQAARNNRRRPSPDDEEDDNGMQDFFQRFFGNPFGEGGPPQAGPRRGYSLGSGVVVDRNGFILTNNHVVEKASRVQVKFNNDPTEYEAKVIGTDAETDVAVIKVTRPNLIPATIGNSDAVQVGDWAVAIGSPFGFSASVTAGIISAKSRDIPGEDANLRGFQHFLQTDAAINKGNSGGPLFNMDGEVIGVNTAIISPTGGSIGIGFAVPSDTAVAVIDQLRQFGETRRGWLGVKIQSITDELADTLGVQDNTGALVASVTTDSPAAKAGIQDGDIILKFDGKDVSSMRGLPRIVAQTPIGKEVDVEILRKGQRMNLRVAVARLVEDDDAAKVATPKDAPKSKGKSRGKEKEKDKDSGNKPASSLIGLVLAPLTDELREKNGLGKEVKGVIVLEVDPASAAAEKGVKPGDVIVEVAQDAVNSVDDITKGIDKVKKAGRKAVLLRLESGKGGLRFVAIPVE